MNRAETREAKENTKKTTGGIYEIMIIAVDFDGILCKNKFPEIGEPNYDIISYTRQLIDQGHEVVLWTTRNGDELEAAVEWCGDYGLHFCNVNGPAPSNAEQYKDKYPTESRKIYADIYIDDHNIEFVMSMMMSTSPLNLVESMLRKGVKRWI